MLTGNPQSLGMNILVATKNLQMEQRNGRGSDSKVTHKMLQVAHRLILGAADHLYTSPFQFIGFSLQVVE